MARRGVRCAALTVTLAVLAAGAATARRPAFSGPTTSSPITISRDGRLVWVVNPEADTVSVIWARRHRVVRTIRVGDEPEAVAVDPANRYAYVANAAAGTVTVIRITDPRPSHFRARRDGRLTTGAEPWNIVASPDGRRVYVANSNQDTITVIDGTRRPRVLGFVDIADSACNDPDRLRHFQPRGLAVTANSRHLYVTGFFAFVRAGGRQADDNGHEGAVCRLDVNTASRRIRSYRPAARIAIEPRITGFTVDATGDGQPDATSAFPNQMQSIVIRGNSAYLPNIAASPDSPQRFDTTTQAFVNVIDGVRMRQQVDSSAARFLNLHLGARDPEPGRPKLFFANPWAIAFTNQRGAGSAYVVSAASDLLVKVNVAADGTLSNTVDADTTRYIDLADSANPATSGANAASKPQGIAINAAGTRAYVSNALSRNVSVVDLRHDRVIRVIRTARRPAPGSQDELVAVGADMFFSSRGLFDKAATATTSNSERLSQAGWQACSSCHFEGLTDGVVWEFGSGPRKSVPLNASFNPASRNEQRVFNYSAIFDEVEDFEANIRNVSGPGPLAQPQDCQSPPPAQSTLDPNHGLLIGDNGDANVAPCVLNQFAKPNADRAQLTITPASSPRAVPALTALREWVRLAVRTPTPPLLGTAPGALNGDDVVAGRALFTQAGCATCHGGQKWTISTKDFQSPPPAEEIATEANPRSGNPVQLQFLARFLRDIGSWNLGVPGKGNDIGTDIGADERAQLALVNGVSQPPQDALGFDFNGDGKGNGFNVPSLLGISAVPPYYHNGACETLACVLSDARHRTANGTLPDRLADPRSQALVVSFLRSIGVRTTPLP